MKHGNKGCINESFQYLPFENSPCMVVSSSEDVTETHDVISKLPVLLKQFLTPVATTYHHIPLQ